MIFQTIEIVMVLKGRQILIASPIELYWQIVLQRINLIIKL